MSGNKLSGRYDFITTGRFAWPTIVMVVFMSLYTMVDGVFVARFIGTDAMSAVNIVYPWISLYIAVGIMLATGSSAIVARQMGERRLTTARENFTFLHGVAVAVGFLFAAAGLAFLDPLTRLMGATPEIYDYCIDYSFILMFFLPLAMLQMMFQSFFVADGRPGLGLAAVVMGGVANLALDYLFIAVYGMGIGGAALATGIGYAFPALCGIWHFSRQRADGLRFVRPRFRLAVLIESCFNGSSEMVSNLAMAVVTYLFNRIMLRRIGVDGVAAITIVLYAQYLLGSIFMGYSIGVAPLFSYMYGKGDTEQLKRLFKNSLAYVGACSAVSLALAVACADPVVGIFTSGTGPVHDLAVHGFRLFSLCFAAMGFNIFASALFTALANGKVSAFLSFLRTFAFIAVALLLLPELFGVNGIWLAVPAAEAASLAVSWHYVARLRGVYRYA